MHSGLLSSLFFQCHFTIFYIDSGYFLCVCSILFWGFNHSQVNPLRIIQVIVTLGHQWFLTFLGDFFRIVFCLSLFTRLTCPYVTQITVHIISHVILVCGSPNVMEAEVDHIGVIHILQAK